jgi:MFS family permease
MSGRPTPVTGRGFYPVAALSGLAFGVLAVGVPLHVAALHRPASLAGQLLAWVTLSVAVGALSAGAIGRLVGSARNLLAASILISGAGHTVLLAASSTLPMALGTAAAGVGIGLFWVSSQTLLGHSSGGAGSERGFAYHYAAYTLGVAGGSALVGVAVAGLGRLGVAEGHAVQLSYGLAAAAMLVALSLWRPARHLGSGVHAPHRVRPRPSPEAIAMQVPDLLLVAALAMIMPLAPLVLVREFGLAPLFVGLTIACVQAGKIGGTLTGRVITRERGHRRAIMLLLGSGAVLSLVLSASASTVGAPLFVVALVATAFVATGAWPLIVDSALARTEPSRRPSATVTWNACEYGVIAVATATSGWLLTSLHSPELLFVLGSALLAAAAVSAAIVLRRPVYAPEAHELEGAT